MSQRCSDPHGWLAWRALAVMLVLTIAGCSTEPLRQGTEPGAAGAHSPEPTPDNPATVEVDTGVGFTVTEAVTISSSTRATHRQAMQHLAAGDLEAGVALLKTVIEQVPEATGPYIDLGIAYGRLGRHDEAVEAFSSAIAATPNHPVAHNELGIAYRRLGRFAEARESYERALEIYPGFHYARRNLAVLCDLYLADFDCALENYQAYQATVPDDTEVEMWLADLRNRSGRAD